MDHEESNMSSAVTDDNVLASGLHNLPVTSEHRNDSSLAFDFDSKDSFLSISTADLTSELFQDLFNGSPGPDSRALLPVDFLPSWGSPSGDLIADFSDQPVSHFISTEDLGFSQDFAYDSLVCPEDLEEAVQKYGVSENALSREHGALRVLVSSAAEAPEVYDVDGKSVEGAYCQETLEPLGNFIATGRTAARQLRIKKSRKRPAAASSSKQRQRQEKISSRPPKKRKTDRESRGGFQRSTYSSVQDNLLTPRIVAHTGECSFSSNMPLSSSFSPTLLHNFGLNTEANSACMELFKQDAPLQADEANGLKDYNSKNESDGQTLDSEILLEHFQNLESLFTLDEFGNVLLQELCNEDEAETSAATEQLRRTLEMEEDNGSIVQQNSVNGLLTQEQTVDVEVQVAKKTPRIKAERCQTEAMTVKIETSAEIPDIVLPVYNVGKLVGLPQVLDWNNLVRQDVGSDSLPDDSCQPVVHSAIESIIQAPVVSGCLSGPSFSGHTSDESGVISVADETMSPAHFVHQAQRSEQCSSDFSAFTISEEPGTDYIEVNFADACNSIMPQPDSEDVTMQNSTWESVSDSLQGSVCEHAPAFLHNSVGDHVTQCVSSSADNERQDVQTGDRRTKRKYVRFVERENGTSRKSAEDEERRRRLLKYFPPALPDAAAADDDVVEIDDSAPNVRASDVNYKTSLPLVQYHNSIFIHPFDKEKGSERSYQTDNLLTEDVRLQNAVNITEKCQAASNLALEKMRRIRLSYSVGKVKTGGKEFQVSGKDLAEKTVRQLMQSAGVHPNTDVDIVLPWSQGYAARDRIRKIKNNNASASTSKGVTEKSVARSRKKNDTGIVGSQGIQNNTHSQRNVVKSRKAHSVGFSAAQASYGQWQCLHSKKRKEVSVSHGKENSLSPTSLPTRTRSSSRPCTDHAKSQNCVDSQVVSEDDLSTVVVEDTECETSKEQISPRNASENLGDLSVHAVADEESTVVDSDESMLPEALDADTVDAEQSRKAVEGTDPENRLEVALSETLDRVTDVNSLPVVEKQGKCLDSEIICDGRSDELYSSPFLLVVKPKLGSVGNGPVTNISEQPTQELNKDSSDASVLKRSASGSTAPQENTLNHTIGCGEDTLYSTETPGLERSSFALYQVNELNIEEQDQRAFSQQHGCPGAFEQTSLPSRNFDSDISAHVVQCTTFPVGLNANESINHDSGNGSFEMGVEPVPVSSNIVDSERDKGFSTDPFSEISPARELSQISPCSESRESLALEPRPDVSLLTPPPDGEHPVSFVLHERRNVCAEASEISHRMNEDNVTPSQKALAQAGLSCRDNGGDFSMDKSNAREDEDCEGTEEQVSCETETAGDLCFVNQTQLDPLGEWIKEQSERINACYSDHQHSGPEAANKETDQSSLVIKPLEHWGCDTADTSVCEITCPDFSVALCESPVLWKVSGTTTEAKNSCEADLGYQHDKSSSIEINYANVHENNSGFEPIRVGPSVSDLNNSYAESDCSIDQLLQALDLHSAALRKSKATSTHQLVQNCSGNNALKEACSDNAQFPDSLAPSADHFPLTSNSSGDLLTVTLPSSDSCLSMTFSTSGDHLPLNLFHDHLPMTFTSSGSQLPARMWTFSASERHSPGTDPFLYEDFITVEPIPAGQNSQVPVIIPTTDTHTNISHGLPVPVYVTSTITTEQAVAMDSACQGSVGGSGFPYAPCVTGNQQSASTVTCLNNRSLPTTTSTVTQNPTTTVSPGNADSLPTPTYCTVNQHAAAGNQSLTPYFGFGASTSARMFVVTHGPPNRYQPPCPCHPVVGRDTQGLPTVPFSPAMLNCPTMMAQPAPVVRPNDIPQNPACISKGVYLFSPTGADNHMAQAMKQKFATSGAKQPVKSRTCKIEAICFGDFKFTVSEEKNNTGSCITFSYQKRKLRYCMVFAPLDEPQQTVITEINFSDITGLWGSDNCLLLELKQAPDMFLAPERCQRIFSCKRSRTIDVTEGQIKTSPYHFITLQKNEVRPVKHELCGDPAFCNLLIQAVTVDLTRQLVASDADDGTPEQHEQRSVCGCKKGCRRSVNCRCRKAGRLCLPACQCKKCNNPYNHLSSLQVPLEDARMDPCLVDRCQKIADLKGFLASPVKLECCGAEVTFLACIPNTRHCPTCSTQIVLSWCLGKVLANPRQPRNHCTRCKKCALPGQKHCGVCGTCTERDTQGFCIVCMASPNC